MKKYLTMIFLSAVFHLPSTYAGGSYNGYVINNTNSSVIVEISGTYGTFYGPNPVNGQYVVGPNSQASYKVTSTGGTINATVTAAECYFELQYNDWPVQPSGYHSYVNSVISTGDCSVDNSNCSSCSNLIINPSSSLKNKSK